MHWSEERCLSFCHDCSCASTVSTVYIHVCHHNIIIMYDNDFVVDFGNR